MARLLLDENVDVRLADYLRAIGHDVQAIAADFPASLKDHDVLSIAVREDRVLLTRDLDFGELVVRDRLPHAGVVLIRLRSRRLAYLQARISRVLAENQDRLHEFLVVTDRDVRPQRR